MYERFTDGVYEVVSGANRDAVRSGCDFVRCEHILLSTLRVISQSKYLEAAIRKHLDRSCVTFDNLKDIMGRDSLNQCRSSMLNDPAVFKELIFTGSSGLYRSPTGEGIIEQAILLSRRGKSPSFVDIPHLLIAILINTVCPVRYTVDRFIFARHIQGDTDVVDANALLSLIEASMEVK